MRIRILRSLAAAPFCAVALFGQADPAPQFEIADVHVSPKTQTAYARVNVRSGRYEIRTAAMVDLIRIAWSVDPDKVLGGPSWLEADRYDVIAKVPADSTPEAHKLMLQSLLRDRFNLKLHNETKALPTFALTAGRKPLLKEADGSEQTGCRPQTSNGPAAPEGGIRLSTMLNGAVATFNLGPGMVIQFQCRDITMAAFAEGLRSMMGSSLGPNPILDETGIKGAWNFDVKWSLQLNGGPNLAGDRITVADALEKQLGLKLETRQVPTPVIVVDSVNRKPTDNPPGVTEALPAVPPPTEFEVADVKPTDPEFRMGNYQFLPGGRLTVKGMSMRFLVNRAFNNVNNEQIVGFPKWVDSDRFDINATVAASGPAAPALDFESMAPLMRALLAERFKMTYHTEDRPVTAYALVAAKPKMKKADPSSRTYCRNAQAPPGSPPGTTVLNCQNTTMADFADPLQYASPALSWPVSDATELEGGWDFSITYSRAPMMAMAARPGGDAAQPGSDLPNAVEPSGIVTIFDAVEKQLGLKLEKQKRTLPVIVIDQLEQKPTDN